MEGLVRTLESGLKWIQRIGIPSSAIAFCIGGYYLVWGGQSGRQKSVGWFIGSAAGLIVIMGATAIATGVDNNISF